VTKQWATTTLQTSIDINVYFQKSKASKFIITQSFIHQLIYVHISNNISHYYFISYVAIWQRQVLAAK